MQFLRYFGRVISRDEKYLWTNHSKMKMRHYRLTESRIKRIIRHPVRIEEGILEGAVACMQPAEGKRYSEIWTMYVVDGAVPSSKQFRNTSRPASAGLAQHSVRRPAFSGDHAAAPPDGFEIVSTRPRQRSRHGDNTFVPVLTVKKKRIKVITAWRYPGKSPQRDPIPPEVLREIRSIL